MLAIAASLEPAQADSAGQPDFGGYIHALATLNRGEIPAMVLTLGVLLFARGHRHHAGAHARPRAARRRASCATRSHALRAERDRLNALLLSEPQILVSWAAADNEPDIIGDTDAGHHASMPQRVLAFGTWLEPDKAQAMERAVDALRASGEGFSMQLMTLNGRAIEADGRAIGGRAVLRLRDVSGSSASSPSSTRATRSSLSDVESLRTLIDALPSPVWARDNAGALVFVNAAYARAVEAKDPADALDARRRAAQPRRRARRRAAPAPPASSMPGGCRRSSPARAASSTCSTCRPARGSAGIGIDATEAEAMRAELKRLGDAHRRTLDQLATGVAIFSADQRLTFYNAAYRSLWDLDAGFLDQDPTDSARARPAARRRASCPRSRTSANGRPRCTRPIARPRPRSTCGTCRTAARCASSPRPTRRAA